MANGNWEAEFEQRSVDEVSLRLESRLYSEDRAAAARTWLAKKQRFAVGLDQGETEQSEVANKYRAKLFGCA